MPNSQLGFTVRKSRADDAPEDGHAMKQHEVAPGPTSEAVIHPRRYFDASPTFQHWNKVTCADVRALRSEPGFQGQGIYFYLNHPIQFIRVVGLLVDIQTVAGGKFTLLTLDDGSGECLVLKIKSRDLRQINEEYPSNTEIDNVDVLVSLGHTTVVLNSAPLHIGDVVKAKGTVEFFRNKRQLDLKRLFPVPSTNAEAQAWSETAKWKRDVLSKPWRLTQDAKDKIDKDILRQAQKERDHARRKQDRSRKVEEKRRRHDEKAEVKRKKLDTIYNAGALKGSHIISAPWD
ncbi:hypothetical protein KC343_g7418 [Hortaea werneckii]|uniref:CST complex subunit Stn1 N-terminal domain-containing protein n=1 Tax=Hortaea werneckii TaxID=91943 RepID=A0A3M7G6M6_HORWE|nr:hypothetical protein KC352_g10967 [Hortaea werneckii]KAI7568966.1 hypothetical protein KC317_g3724 [Hortaea werneckii]KAI7622258.1 hypothetical protein KC346_g3292 [Hortaea werneckii]KAI7623136.1 hypothetical protein KC343_g7418 [Hortaea werneckii]KAI7641703.1 hypothetical protein KC319_g13376 [Hortaea werneckii]